MIERLIVHIGPQKTGSTSLQRAFERNAQALRERGLCYPLVGGPSEPGGHALVGIELGAREKVFAPGKHWARFKSDLLRSDCELGILSAEALSQLSDEHAAEAVQLFATLAKRIDVLAYVRHPVHFANSDVSQQMRRGLRLAAIVEKPPVVYYRGKVRRWTKALNASAHGGQVIVRPYRRDVERGWSVVDDALGVCGLPDQAIEDALDEDENRSLSALGVYLLDWVNGARGGERLDRETVAFFEKLGGASFVLPDTARERLDDHTKRINAWLLRDYGFQLSERRLTPTPCPLNEEELASLASLILESGTFASRVDKSRIGGWLGLRSPALRRRPSTTTATILRRIGLTAFLLRSRARPRQSVDRRT